MINDSNHGFGFQYRKKWRREKKKEISKPFFVALLVSEETKDFNSTWFSKRYQLSLLKIKQWNMIGLRFTFFFHLGFLGNQIEV